MMTSEFDYVAEKIKNQPFVEEPFPHLLINDFLSVEHFETIIGDSQIHFKPLENQDTLFQHLMNEGYEIIENFPGCIYDWEQYKENLIQKTHQIKGKPVEGYGMALRLKNIKNQLIRELITFLNGATFKQALHEKFNIQQETTIISAIQKYLTGYEISPHPDWQGKALTYLLNLNNPHVEADIHTHLLKFKPEFEWIAKFWQLNPKISRCWVPWDYCETVIKTKANNSIVLFKPDSNPATLHAVKLDYNHLNFQRTQIYGNLHYAPKKSFIDMDYKQINAFKSRQAPLNLVERNLNRFI
ncbi:MAG: hypothetical protein WBP46_14280 [Thiolinea sp.]